MALFASKDDDDIDYSNDDLDIDPKDRIMGKIFHLDLENGWGFISSHSIKFTRIFFHWTALQQDTLNFTQLTKGMKVEFNPKDYGDKGWRAVKIKVVE